MRQKEPKQLLPLSWLFFPISSPNSLQNDPLNIHNGTVINEI